MLTLIKIFIKNAHFSKTKLHRKCPCCIFLQISVIFGFMESGVLYICFHFQFVSIWCFHWSIWRKLILTQRSSWWREKYFDDHFKIILDIHLWYYLKAQWVAFPKEQLWYKIWNRVNEFFILCYLKIFQSVLEI